MAPFNMFGSGPFGQNTYGGSNAGMANRTAFATGPAGPANFPAQIPSRQFSGLGLNQPPYFSAMGLGLNQPPYFSAMGRQLPSTARPLGIFSPNFGYPGAGVTDPYQMQLLRMKFGY